MSRNVLDVEQKLFSVNRESSEHLSTKGQRLVAPDPKSQFQSWIDSLESARSSPPLTNNGSTRSEIAFDGVISVSGYICADVRSMKGTALIAESGEIDGDVAVETAIVQGLIRGEITANNVELGSTARVIGQIHAAALSIEAGAVFEGQSAYLSNADRQQSEISSSSLSSPEVERQDEFPAVLAVA